MPPTDRGVGLSPPKEAQQDDGDALERRPDMNQAKKSLKLLRGLCKEYGLSFRLPEGSAFGSSRKERRLSGARDRDDGEEGGSSSSSTSSFEFSSEDEKKEEDSSAPSDWATVKNLLNGLQTHERITALKEINLAMSRTSVDAQAHLKDLDALEQGSKKQGGQRRQRNASVDEDGGGGDSSAASDDDDTDQSLLHFNAQAMPVAQALRRCMDIVPDLRKRALEKEAERLKDVKFRAEEEERRRSDDLRAIEDLENDTGLRGEVERKLRSLGSLPLDADPDLLKILEEQKAEARRLVKQIQEEDQEVIIKRLALDYVDNKLNFEGVDQTHIEAAMGKAKELKAALFVEKRAEAERKLELERRTMEVPTEDDVQEAVLEQEKLQKEVERMADQIRRMQETQVFSKQSTTEAQGANRKSRRALAVTTEAAVPNMPVPLDKVHEVHPQLLKESAELEQLIQQEDKHIANSEGLLKNAEQTLKVIEECKILFLEQVARERPALVEALLKSEEDNDDKSSLASSDSETMEGTMEEDDAAARLALGAEERWLRMQLSQFKTEEGGEGVNDDPAADDSAGVEDSAADYHPFDEVAQDILKLSRQLEVEAAKARGETPPPPVEGEDDAAEDDDEYESPEIKAIEALSREEAAERLRRLPHEEVRGILRLQAENAELMKRVEEAQAEIDRQRGERGATQDLLGDIGVPMEGTSPRGEAGEAPDPALVEEVLAKVRMLRALRKRWWMERQDPSTTVRRSLAAAGLPEAANVEDQPPTRLQATLFERIQESMTLP
mmetsp:Transcript_4407/g.13355  ORF Transcript_4407/g.13355 Transcript_4407/m.13355 type:complete len:783 (-) Transcript_4407:40-2388(-)